jgi:hypothetical protein
MQNVRKTLKILFSPIIWLFKTLVVEAYGFLMFFIFFMLIACLPFPIYWNVLPALIFLYFGFKLQTNLTKWAKTYDSKTW